MFSYSKHIGFDFWSISLDNFIKHKPLISEQFLFPSKYFEEKNSIYYLSLLFFKFFSLSGLKLNEKPAGVVVSSPDGPVFLTPADLTSSSVQPVVTSADGTPAFATDFTTFEAPRTISYQDTQYRPENELYCTSGEFANQRIANSDGHFVPYQYKVAQGPLTNHSVINSPDSGIGELNNASEW